MAKAILAAGMGFGDEGKGSVIDFLARKHSAKLVVRYNGGAQAAHSVVLDDGRHHTFSQFGSGTFVPGCRTHLSRFMLIQPGAMFSEAIRLQKTLGMTALEEVLNLLTIEDKALITTRFHAAVNHLREVSRGKDRHGSCGMGIGETVVDHDLLGEETLFARDMTDPIELRRKLRLLQDANRAKVEPLIDAIPPVYKYHATEEGVCPSEWDWLTNPELIEREAKVYENLAQRVQIVDASWLDTQLEQPGTILFEGAQGILLDQYTGFMPYCTRSTISFDNAMTLLAGHNCPTTKMGILRSYLTRHGAGPFPTEDPSLHPTYREKHNRLGRWQESFRTGHFDLVLFQYAMEALGGVDEIAVTHMDAIPETSQVCMTYDRLSKLVLPKQLQEQFKLTEALREAVPYYTRMNPIEAIESHVGRPIVSLLSHGPKASDKIPRAL